MIPTLQAWLATRSERERRLVATAAVVAGGTLLLVAGDAARSDLVRARARVAGLERELVAVRRLAAARTPADDASDDGPSTLARLQAAADDVGLRDRIAAMTPSTGSADGGAGDRVALRVAGASLAETVGMLHALAADTPPPRVERFALHKHPDDATRFDLVLEASQPRRAP